VGRSDKLKTGTDHGDARLGTVETAIAHLGLLEDEAIVLDLAALEIAALDHADSAIEPYAELLAGMAARIAVLGADAATPRERSRVLSRVIADEFAFAGDRQTYDSPDNADLMRVIDRRRGLPVSLTILYVAAARRIGWQADALNTPGHVLARLGSDTGPVLLDPFHGGGIVGAAELGSLLENALGPRVRPSAEHLAPMSNRTVLVRLLMNQASRAEAAGNLDRALVLYRRITSIAPDHPHPWWDRARLEAAAGDPAAARASLSAMLEVTREPELRNHVCAALDALSRLTK
jgi:regulator of sirC expression with transglutaminase-like and TPR domain